MTASFEGHVDIVRMLIEAKAQVNTQNEVYMLLLPPHTVQPYHTQCYCIIYLYMSYLCFCPQDGWTALHMAAQEGKHDVVRLLTEAKAHVNLQTKVHTLRHVWSTDLDSHFLSGVRGESICIYRECCVHACFIVDVNKCSNNVLLLVSGHGQMCTW